MPRALLEARFLLAPWPFGIALSGRAAVVRVNHRHEHCNVRRSSYFELWRGGPGEQGRGAVRGLHKLQPAREHMRGEGCPFTLDKVLPELIRRHTGGFPEL